MDRKNAELLNEIVGKELTQINVEKDLEVKNDRIKTVLPLIDKIYEYDKAISRSDELAINKSMETLENERKYEVKMKELDADKRSNRTDHLIKVAEIFGVVVLGRVIDNFYKNKFATRICEFEKDYSFTTTAGRSIKDFFRHK